MNQTGPMQFGPYVVLRQIGTGGMGSVYRARDRRLGRDVAIKVLHRHLEMSSARERFLREARAVSSLNHPNITTIYDIGEEDGDLYLVMELLEGRSLKERLLDRDRPSQEEVVRIARHTATALTAAHANGIVHRDIKPANLFLVTGPDGQPQVKVLDFGLAKVEEDLMGYDAARDLTRFGSTVGTVEYMSPEQARGEPLDPRSDLFSLGVLLYELTTGHLPFRGATSAVVFAELLGSNPVSPRRANANVSPELDRIICHLMEKDRNQRMPSANALLKALRTVDGPGAVTAEPPIRIAAPDQEAKPVPEFPTERPSDAFAVAGGPPRQRAVAAAPAQKHLITVRDPDGRTMSRSSTPRISGQQTLPSPRSSSAQQAAVQTALHESALAEPVAEEAPADASDQTQWRWGWVATIAIVIAGLVGLVIYARTRPEVAVSLVPGTLQVTQFQNYTGDAVLQESPAVAMQLLLREMPTLKLAGFAPAPDTVEPDAQESARKSGAEAYLTGSVSGDDGRYHIHIELRRASDNNRLAQDDADAPTLAQIPEALSTLALKLRARLGETVAQAKASAIPLSAEGSASLDALGFYARGTALLRNASPAPAAEQFLRALKADPGFTAARLELVEALGEAGAETERREALVPLRTPDRKGSPCQQRHIAYALASHSTAAAAAELWATDCPMQASAETAFSRALLADGKGSEAESAGNRAIALDPGNPAAVTAVTEAMISQNHYDAALMVQSRSASGGAMPGLMLLASYLRGDARGEQSAKAPAAASDNFGDIWNYVTYLGSTGKLGDAQRVGDAAAKRIDARRLAASAATLLRSRLAAMEAMAGHCDIARPADAKPAAAAGDEAIYYTALASAWCGRKIDALPTDPERAAIVRGAAARNSGNLSGALAAMGSETGGPQSATGALLRGDIHQGMKQPVLAVGDYSSVMSRKGAALLSGTLAYPAALSGLAAAYHATGDDANASRVRELLHAAWAAAPATEPLLRNAIK